jgi:exopolysaccharide biosynthesis protein
MSQPKTRFEQPELIIKGGEEMGFLSTLIVLMKQGAKITRDITKEVDGKSKKMTQKIGRMAKIDIVKGHFHGRTIVEEVAIVDKGILEYAEDLAEYKKSLKGKL